jgi:hypothetical protein
LHIAEEISENRFKIAGGEAEMKVCWQVTGTRKDPWAAANPFEVEQAKAREEKGRYLEPSLYDAPEEQRVREPGIGEEPPQPPPFPLSPSFEAPQASEMPPSFGFGSLEEFRQQIDELRGQIEELRQRKGR